ncbi:hypothetical protein FTV95_14500 [Escherichia coli]|nr:hypothetical protein FTV95_14500 [Escherichia coli]HAH6497304.1 hypothetical protein [Escherichia coli]
MALTKGVVLRKTRNGVIPSPIIIFVVFSYESNEKGKKDNRNKNYFPYSGEMFIQYRVID